MAAEFPRAVDLFRRSPARGVLIGALVGLAVLGQGAQAFVVEKSTDGSSDPVADLRAAPRWDALSGSLLGDGERGLGGGLEYAIDTSVCAELNFVDAPSCAAVHAQIREAAAMWAKGHRILRFTDVTGHVAPERAPADEPWIGHGAEIDFFADGPESFQDLHGLAVGADARNYYRFSPKPRDGEGRVLEGVRGAYTAVDIRFNTRQCFYVDPEAAVAGCMHFGSVAAHELAHALGLDHPDEAPDRNLDTDLTADNGVEIDCRAPFRGLRVNRAISARAAAHSQVRGAAVWTTGLSADDRAGRDALYPSCAPAEDAPQWAAFAIGSEGVFGWSRAYEDAQDARQRALSECAKLGGRGCAAAATFTECFSLARARTGAYGWAVRRTPSMARSAAVSNCDKRGPGCATEAVFCASDEASS